MDDGGRLIRDDMVEPIIGVWVSRGPWELLPKEAAPPRSWIERNRWRAILLKFRVKHYVKHLVLALAGRCDRDDRW